MSLISQTILATILLGFLFGCSSMQYIEEPKGYEPAMFWSAQTMRRAQLKKVSASLSLNYSGMEQGSQGTGKGQMIADMPNKFRMEVRDPLGRVHLVAGLEGQKFALLYPRINRFHKDKQAGKSFLNKIVGFDYSFNFLLPLMFGNLPENIGTHAFKTWQWDPKQGVYKAELNVKGAPWTLWINPKNSAIEKIEIVSNGTPFSLDYVDFSRCCGGSEINEDENKHFDLAKSMTLENKKGKTSLDVRWKEIMPQDKAFPKQAFQVAVPNGMLPMN